MSRKNQIKSALSQLTPESYFQLNTYSESVMCREAAHELGIPIKVKKMGTVYMVVLKGLDPFENIELRSLSKGLVSKPLTKYIQAAKHWEFKTAPVGMSGVVIAGLDWYEQGHEDIPEDWIIYDNRMNTLFKPRFVINPALLTNVVTDEMGLPPTKECVTPEYYAMDKDKAEIIFETLKEFKA